MSGITMGNLQIIKKPVAGVVNTNENTIVSQRDPFINKIEKIQKEYSSVQQGHISENDFKKLLLRNHPRLVSDISNDTRAQLSTRLKHLISWYLEVKNILIGYNDHTKDMLQFRELTENYNNLKIFLNGDRNDKMQSKLVKNIIELFIGDSPINPKYGICDSLGRVLAKTDRNSSYIKELTLCFSLYRKYLDTIATDFVQSFEFPEGQEPTTDLKIIKSLPEPVIKFRTIHEVQPRFSMINDHIRKSVDTFDKDHKTNARNFNVEIFGNIDNFNKDIIPLTVNQEVSNMGIKKRLTEINNWINNGLIQAQHQYNRLNNLKIVRTQSNINKNFEATIDNNFKVWGIIKDTEKYLESIEDLLLGKAFLTGMNNQDNLDVLEVNY